MDKLTKPLVASALAGQERAVDRVVAELARWLQLGAAEEVYRWRGAVGADELPLLIGSAVRAGLRRLLARDAQRLARWQPQDGVTLEAIASTSAGVAMQTALAKERRDQLIGLDLPAESRVHSVLVQMWRGVPPTDMRLFCEIDVAGRDPRAVAAELGIERASVLETRSRLITRVERLVAREAGGSAARGGRLLDAVATAARRLPPFAPPDPRLRDLTLGRLTPEAHAELAGGAADDPDLAFGLAAFSPETCACQELLRSVWVDSRAPGQPTPGGVARGIAAAADVLTPYVGPAAWIIALLVGAMLLWPSTPESPPLPDFELVELAADHGGLVPGYWLTSDLVMVLRPQSTLTGPVGWRLFVDGPAGLRLSPAGSSASVAANGAIKLVAPVRAVVGGGAGDWTLVAVVGRPEDLSSLDASDVRAGELPEGLQVLHQPLRISDLR